MAATSTLQYGRQKKSVYGKASKSTWSSTNFFDDSDDEPAAPAPAPTAKVSTQRSASIKTVYPVQKAAVQKASPPKATKTSKAKQDTFDVPSSDDEASPPPQVVRNPFLRSKKTLVNDAKGANGDANLAPWEERTSRAASGESTGVSKAANRAASKADAQLSSDPADATSSTAPKGKLSSPLKSASQTAPRFDHDFSKLPSAAARLAARKRMAEGSTSIAEETTGRSNSKRLPAKTAPEGSPRKRAKTSNSSQESNVDVEMADAALPLCDNGSGELGSGGADIYDFPGSGADESPKPIQRSSNPRISKPARRTKPTTYGARASARKGLSAPARLAEMLPTDSDMTEASTVSPPDSVSRAATPQQPSTPPSGRTSTLDTAVRSGGTITPKQAQLWNRLLPGPPAAHSPSALAMEDLTISGQKSRSNKRPSAAKRFVQSQSGLGRRKTRLVDRLKATAESSSEDESDESDSASVGVEEVSEVVQKKPALVRAESTQSQSNNTSASQSQGRSQTSSSHAVGLKRTYASQRSHLAEDNLEDDLMAGLMDETPKQPAARPKTFGRSQSNHRKDAFDMDDSDEDAAGTGGIRSIHELRAAGRSIRGNEDLEQLLEDIETHSTALRSRRRSTLMELATKLADKNFASRFIGQGCDVRLARQCRGSQDDIANFAMATAVALMLGTDPPEHTPRMLQERSVATWLGSLLASTKEITKMAKERQYNMAKSQQASVVQLATFVQGQQSLWSEGAPTVMTTRIIVLRALDLLVSKLRRAGDKSELLSPEELTLVLPTTQPTTDADFDTSLAISVLESLSTAALALAWPTDLLARISTTLTALDTSTPKRRHTLFLTLRLTLNLTTDNPRNSAFLATEHSVPYLLTTVLTGFTTLDTTTTAMDDETRHLALDLLVLALGILINVFEHSASARTYPTHPPTTTQLTALVTTFVAGHQRSLDAESLTESISNVALGYLAVALANLCQDPAARSTVRDALPGRRLALLGDAVEEFVVFHQQVDGMAGGSEGGGGSGEGPSLEEEEGASVWGGFTEKLRGVLDRVRGVEDEG